MTLHTLIRTSPVAIAAVLPFVERDMQCARRRGHIVRAEEDRRVIEELRAQLSEVSQ